MREFFVVLRLTWSFKALFAELIKNLRRHLILITNMSLPLTNNRKFSRFIIEILFPIKHNNKFQ